MSNSIFNAEKMYTYIRGFSTAPEGSSIFQDIRTIGSTQITRVQRGMKTAISISMPAALEILSHVQKIPEN